MFLHRYYCLLLCRAAHTVQHVVHKGNIGGSSVITWCYRMARRRKCRVTRTVPGANATSFPGLFTALGGEKPWKRGWSKWYHLTCVFPYIERHGKHSSTGRMTPWLLLWSCSLADHEERESEVSWLEHFLQLETRLNRNTPRWFEKPLWRAIRQSTLLFWQALSLSLSSKEGRSDLDKVSDLVQLRNIILMV